VPSDFGGRIRSFHMLKELAKRHRVTFATFYRHQPDDPHHELKRLFEKLVLIPLPLPEGRSWKDYFLYAATFFSRLPHSMAKYYRPQVRRAIQRLLSEDTFDVVVCDFIYPAGVIDWSIPAKIVLFTHNIEAEVWERQSQVSRSLLWRLASRLEYRAMRVAEEKYVRLADHVVAVSQANKNFFAQYVPADRITVVSTGVDAEFFCPNPLAEQPNHVVFTGSYDWLPNADAMEWYFHEILPLARKEIPDLETWVIGKSPSATLRRFAESDPKFHVTGRVDDVRPYIDRASVYIVPMRSGSGTRLKVFEAMASGKAILSTPTGVEGLPVEHGHSAILAGTAEEFARQLVDLLRDAPLRNRLGRQARALVEERYSWTKAGEEFESILAGTVAAGKDRQLS
jgi:glycosyltransferase involved in cell wall biosynthesis